MYHRTTRPWQEERWFLAPSDGSAQSITVQEQEKDAFSGLCDANGNKLFREKEKIGFVK